MWEECGRSELSQPCNMILQHDRRQLPLITSAIGNALSAPDSTDAVMMSTCTRLQPHHAGMHAWAQLPATCVLQLAPAGGGPGQDMSRERLPTRRQACKCHACLPQLVCTCMYACEGPDANGSLLSEGLLLAVLA